MMTPAGWAHLDYETDETAEQLQQTLDQSGRDIAALQPLRALPGVARAQRSAAGLPPRRVRRPYRLERGHRAHRLPPELGRGRRHVPLAGEPLQRPPRVVVLPRPDHRRDDRLRGLRLDASVRAQHAARGVRGHRPCTIRSHDPAWRPATSRCSTEPLPRTRRSRPGSARRVSPRCRAQCRAPARPRGARSGDAR